MHMNLEEWIDRYGDEILRLCLAYLGDRQLAEDAFQETFLKAWKARETFRKESSEKTWLSHIAVNTCRDLLRSGWLRMRRKSRPFEELADSPSPAQPWEEGPVRTAVLELAGKYREVILLYYDQNMTIAEIAQLLHVNENTVSTRLRRARAKLAKRLREEIEL